MNKQMESDELFSLNQILKGTSYKPVSKISYGSYGQIFRIHDSYGKDYVLKVVSKERMAKQSKLHEAIIQGFVLSKLNHPGVIKYYQTIETKQHICQVQQYCLFGDLFGVFKKINKNIELNLKKKEISLFYLAQVLQSMSYLHSLGLIHRDLKLQNIVVAGDLNAKIVDFGTAKPVKMCDFYSKQQVGFIDKLRNNSNENTKQQQNILRTKSFVGSANYLSPQSISLQYSLASDIWSFGILAYKLFHGRLPFEGENNAQIFKKIRENNLNINEKLDPQIQQLIKACLKVDPQDRPSSLELKLYPYFKGVNFETLFKQPSPINRQILLKLYMQGSDENRSSALQKNAQFEITLEKRMFFGNYKARILKVYRRGQGLFMSYWYVDGKAPKNEFELMLSDYAQVINKNEFDVHNMDIKYTFKVKKQDSAQEIVQTINTIIKKHYEL